MTPYDEDEYNPQGDPVPQKNDGVNDKYDRKFTSGTEPSSNFSQPTGTQENEWDYEDEYNPQGDRVPQKMME